MVKLLEETRHGTTPCGQSCIVFDIFDIHPCDGQTDGRQHIARALKCVLVGELKGKPTP